MKKNGGTLMQEFREQTFAEGGTRRALGFLTWIFLTSVSKMRANISGGVNTP